LIRRLRALPQPQGYTLVSTDRAITAVAAEHGVPVKASHVFAAEINAPAAERRTFKGRRSQRPRPEPKLPQSEVDAWLKAFEAGKDG
jgi:hypothetical protein